MNNLIIEQLDVNSIFPYDRNSRTHSDQQIKQIEASISEFGFTNPILIDADGVIIAGHGRLVAAKNLGIRMAPCIRLGYLTEEQKRAYVIADNKLAENAGWNIDLLRLEVADLSAAGYSLDLLGFDSKDIDQMLKHVDGTVGLTDEDDVPEIDDEIISKTGDIWHLGRHKIICGSSTNPLDVSKLLGDVKPNLMVTDPPYGVEYDASWREKRGLGNGHNVAKGKVLNDHIADWSDAYRLFPGDVAYVWHASLKTHIVAESLVNCGFSIRSQIIWAKSSFVIGRGNYHHHHEPCWYVVREKRSGNWTGDRKQSTIWNINKQLKNETGHSTQKPVECMRRPILNNSSPGQAVYEPFSGSGTTIIAAEETGRTCYAVELNPAYVDMAVKRWEKFTGNKGELFRA